MPLARLCQNLVHPAGVEPATFRSKRKMMSISPRVLTVKNHLSMEELLDSILLCGIPYLPLFFGNNHPYRNPCRHNTLNNFVPDRQGLANHNLSNISDSYIVIYHTNIRLSTVKITCSLETLRFLTWHPLSVFPIIPIPPFIIT